ncbi:hypothetical protein C4K35_4094 [Pseudomonas chlororaphis subsp. piscium]|nr:hypothetical protein C4K35_4094 [Pseudomonas chlororaphis subsp. piscium]
MFLSIMDRISIKCHDVMGGNISSGRALLIAERLKGAQNIPDNIAKVITKKIEKHPELKRKMPEGISAKLAENYARNALGIYNKGIAQLKNDLEGLQKEQDRYPKVVQRISSSILDSNKSVKFRLEVKGVMEEFGTSFGEINDLKKNLYTLSREKYACSEKIKLHRETQGNLTKQFDDKANLTPPWAEAQKTISKLEDRMSRLDSKMTALKNKLLDDKEIMALSTITVAEYRKDLVSKDTQLLVNAYKASFSSFQSIPNKVDHIAKNLDRLQDRRENVVGSLEDLEHIHLLEVTNKLVKDTNVMLDSVHNKNQKLESTVKKIMKEQLGKSEELNFAISGVKEGKEGKEANVVPYEALSLPDVPNNKPGISSNSSSRKTPELSS